MSRVFAIWIVALAVVSGQAPQTFEAVISDSMCVLHHESGAEGQHTTDEDCTRDCVRGGSKYVLVVKGKALAVANQEHPGLSEHAGRTVTVEGTLDGDTVTVRTIRP
jgi:hypothetical protein